MQVINQSLGAARQWPQYPDRAGLDAPGQQGRRDGRLDRQQRSRRHTPDALFAAGAPGVGAEVIGVASFDNAQRSRSRSTARRFGYIQATGCAAGADRRQRCRWSRTGTPTTADDACIAASAGQPDRHGGADPPRHLQLLRQGEQRAERRRRGRGALQQRGRRAQPDGRGHAADHDPGGGDHRRAGRDARRPDRRRSDDADLDGADYVSSPFGTGGLISGFSSFGLAADLSLSRNIGAPGRRHLLDLSARARRLRRRCRAPRCRRRTSPAGGADARGAAEDSTPTR